MSPEEIVKQQEESKDPVGRTVWDFFHSISKSIKYALIAIALIVVLVVLYLNYTEEIEEFCKTYWPVLLAPVAGYYFGDYYAKKLNRVYRRVVFTVNPETHEVRVISIPEAIFPYLNQTGNSVGYHTRLGVPAYIARNFDDASGHIDYGWLHEADAAIVMTREDAYIKWIDDFEALLKESLELMFHPQILALGYSRNSIKKIFDLFGEKLGYEMPEEPEVIDNEPVEGD